MFVYLWPYFLRVSWGRCLRNSAVCCLMSAWNVSCGNQFPSQAVRPFLGLAGFLTFGENNSCTHGNLTSTMKVYRCRCLLLGQQKIDKQLYTNPLQCRVDMWWIGDNSTVILQVQTLELLEKMSFTLPLKSTMGARPSWIFCSHVVLWQFHILMNGFETVSSFVKCFIFW